MSTNGLSQYVEQKEATVTALASNLANNAVAALQAQRRDLNAFIKGCLSESIDFGIIPGTKTPSLFKPGAEKLANLFKIGMKIVSTDKDLDLDKNWAMFTYRVELIHLPSNTVVAQCEGSANSQEKKYKSRPAVDQLNTLQKMAQKRAYVGAVIIATGASDFFTQDTEDMDPKDLQSKPERTPTEFKNGETKGNLSRGATAYAEPLKNVVDLGNYELLAAPFTGQKLGAIEVEVLEEHVQYWLGLQKNGATISGKKLADLNNMYAYLQMGAELK